MQSGQHHPAYWMARNELTDHASVLLLPKIEAHPVLVHGTKFCFIQPQLLDLATRQDNARISRTGRTVKLSAVQETRTSILITSSCTTDWATLTAVSTCLLNR
jgi:hypothetical protein